MNDGQRAELCRAIESALVDGLKKRRIEVDGGHSYGIANEIAEAVIRAMSTTVEVS